MSRIAKPIILSLCDEVAIHDILEAESFYSVVYNGQPFTYRKQVSSTNKTQYKKTSFTNKGFALVLANKLNSLFRTNKFEVIEHA